MKIFLTVLSLLTLMIPPVLAQEDAWSYMNDNRHPGEETHRNMQKREEVPQPESTIEDEDPWEPLNRGIFWFNETLDSFFLDRLSAMYKGVVPEFMRERVGYVLRNLSEPIVFTNNLLQGEVDDAEDTLRRFLINSTVGIGGLFDISTDLKIPYKKEDFGLTLASWGMDSGPYLVLPILGPSNVRDAFGRIGDYAFDPINWGAYLNEKGFYSMTRTGVQIIDAKTDNLELIEELRKNSIDYYVTLRSLYIERRKYLMGKGRPSETPRPDDED